MLQQPSVRRLCRCSPDWCVRFISYLLWSANIIADLGFGTLHPNNTLGLAALGIVFAALLVRLTAGKHVEWKAVLPCLAVVLIGLCIAEVHHQNGRYTVTYLPCGSGQAILLSDTEHAMLIDCGSYRNAARQVREWLRWNGLKRLDTVVLTAVDQGHARNLPELMETVEVWGTAHARRLSGAPGPTPICFPSCTSVRRRR